MKIRVHAGGAVAAAAVLVGLLAIASAPASGATGFGVSPPFHLDSRIEQLEPTLFHLGDDAGPPCTLNPPPTPSGTEVTVTFDLTGVELGSLHETGATLRFLYYSLETTALEVTLNGNALAAPAINPGCISAATYRQPVTSFLHSGANMLVLSLTGAGDLEDCIVGDVALYPGSIETEIAVMVSTRREIARFDIAKDEDPYDNVRVHILVNDMRILSGQPSDGQIEFHGLHNGTFAYEVTQPTVGGDLLAEGEFTIDLSNAPPEIAAATVEPSTIVNDGTGQVEFRVTASDEDGEIEGVYLDLRALGGVKNTPMEPEGGDHVLTHAISTSVPAALYRVPTAAVDDLAAAANTTISLLVTPAGGVADTTLNVLGFTITAGQISSPQSGQFTAVGNVTMTHSSGLPLKLEANGGLLVTLDPPQILSQGEVTLKADLGDLGIFDLAHGEFRVEEGSGLTFDETANYLLDDLLGYVLDTDAMDIDLLFEQDPGILITSHIILDEMDGEPGNNLPVANVAVTARMSGAVDGSLSSQQGDLHWDLAAGTLALQGATWHNDTITVHDASFTFLPDTFGPNPVSVGVPVLTITPQGISADAVTVDDFAFNYGGFDFNVARATITNEAFRADTTCVGFPLPSGEVSSCVYDIEIADGQLNLSGGEIRVPPLKVGSYDLAGIYAHFAQDEYGQFVLEAEGQLAIPSLATVGVAFTLNSECEYLLQRFCMAAAFQGVGIPIGTTGMLLTDIGGCIVDPTCDNSWMITFTASVSSADRISPPGISLLSGDVEATILTSPIGLEAEGTVYLVGFQLGGAGFGLYPTRLHGYGFIDMPPGLAFLHAQAGLDVYWVPQFSFLGTADGTLSIPAGTIPLWDQPINLAGYHAEIGTQGVQGQFFVPGPSNPILDVTASFYWTGSYGFDAHLHWPWLYMEPVGGERLGVRRYRRQPVPIDLAGGVPGMGLNRAVYTGGDHSGGGAAAPQLVRRNASDWVLSADADRALSGWASAGLAFRDTIETVTVPASASPLIFHLIEKPEGTGVEVDLALVTPGAVTVDSVYCATHEGFSYAKGTDHIYYRIDAPEEGLWGAVVTDIDAGEDYLLEARFLNLPPTISVTAPAGALTGTTEDTYPIEWATADPEGDGLTVSLYAVRAAFESAADSLNAGPWLIASGLPDSVSTFAWLPREFGDGVYRIVTRVEDAYHPAIPDTCAFTITLTNTAGPEAPANLRARVGPEKLRIVWDRVADPDVKGYRLLWAMQDSAHVDALDVGNVDRHVLSSLRNYQPYEIRLEAYDIMDQTSPASDVLVATPNPLGDADAPDVPWEVTGQYDSETNVIALTWNEVPDAVTYRVHYDTDVIGAYRGVGATEGDSPVLQSRVGGLTLSNLPRGKQYYVTVSAQDAAGNESATADPIAVLVTDFRDTDADGLPDDWEMEGLGSLEYGPGDDPDGDLLANSIELTTTKTHPARRDTDGDGVRDGSDAHPLSSVDDDRDGMPDDWETYYGVSDAGDDPDADLLINVREFTETTSPWDPDTDADMLGDGFEADSLGTDPWNPDTDGGGEWDGYEFFGGRDPLDPDDDIEESAVEEGETIPLAVTGLGSQRPNPFTNSLTLSFSLARAEHVDIRVFDVAGRMVRVLTDERRLAGLGRASWDGREASGVPASAGVYYIRFRAGDVAQVARAILVR